MRPVPRVTEKLALDVGSVGLMTPSTTDLRRARLDRLRAARSGPAGTPPGPPSPWRGPYGDAAQRARTRTESLAAELGGRSLGSPGGPVVIVESSVCLPATLEGLGRLPDPVGPAATIVCLDTETTGLGTAAGTLPFMVGLGSWRAERFVVRQLVLADHVDEAALLAVLAAAIPADAWLVTYNGRTFDWPLLVARYRMHSQSPPPLAGHLDLLPVARQVWKHRLADARLASVEAGVAGVRRHQDLPGALIPARYLEYLRSRRGDLLREVLEHNRQDVVSLGLLLRILSDELLAAARGASGQQPAVLAADLGGLGRLFARRKRHVDALACFDGALERLLARSDAARYELIAADRARTLTRLGRREEAEGAWHALALEGGRMAALAWLQVAKHREHDAADFGAALEATRKARALADRARLFGHRDRLVERDLARRTPRLQRRLGERRAHGAASGFVAV